MHPDGARKLFAIIGLSFDDNFFEECLEVVQDRKTGHAACRDRCMEDSRYRTAQNLRLSKPYLRVDSIVRPTVTEHARKDSHLSLIPPDAIFTRLL